MTFVPSSRGGRRPGAVAVQVAICLTLLLGVAALAVDGGILMAERGHAQATADAAALAAALDLIRAPRNSSTTATAVAAAKQTGSKVGSINYGYSDSSNTPNLTVTTNIPPTSGTFTDSSKYPDHAEVIVQWNQPRGFSAIWGSDSIPVRARAVARPDILSILTLSPTATRGLNLAGTALNAPGRVVIDSTTSTALGDSVGGGSVTAEKIDVVGTNSLSSGAASPPPTTGASSAADPLASLPLPSYATYGGLPNPLPTGYNTGNGGQYTAPSGSSSTIYPGRYAKITVSASSTVTMSPGVYYLTGNGTTTFTSMAINGTLTGTGVLIYNGQLNGSTTDPTRVGSIQINPAARVTLTPPTSGTWQGISIFQDRNNVGATMTLAGRSGTNISGLVYAAKAPVQAAGGSNIVPGSAFIVGSLSTGGGTLSLPVPSVRVPLLGASVRLVE